MATVEQIKDGTPLRTAQELLRDTLRELVDATDEDAVVVNSLVGFALLDLEGYNTANASLAGGDQPYLICEYRGKEVYVNSLQTFSDCNLYTLDGALIAELSTTTVHDAV
jgi:hypothetical protein